MHLHGLHPIVAFKILPLLVFSVIVRPLNGGSSDPVSTTSIVHSDINWITYLGEHDMIYNFSQRDGKWTKLPTNWLTGPFTGNGWLGTVMYELSSYLLRACCDLHVFLICTLLLLLSW